MVVGDGGEGGEVVSGVHGPAGVVAQFPGDRVVAGGELTEVAVVNGEAAAVAPDLEVQIADGVDVDDEVAGLSAWRWIADESGLCGDLAEALFVGSGADG